MKDKKYAFSDNPIIPRSEVDLIEILERNNVHWQQWEKGDRKKLTDLFTSLHKDQVELNTTEGRLILFVHVAVVIVRLPKSERNETELELYETFQENIATGEKFSRNFRGIGETIEGMETPHVAAVRGLKEELGFDQGYHYRLSANQHIDWKGPADSHKWPGLTAKYFRKVFGCIIHPDLYKDSYVEEKGGRKIHFEWRIAPHKDEFVIPWPSPFSKEKEFHLHNIST